MNQFGKWVPHNVQPHGRVTLQVRPDPSAQQQLNLPPLNNSVVTTVRALADSGAQMCVADWSIAKQLQLTKQDLLHPALTVSVADNTNLELMGAHFMTLSSDSGASTHQLVYFATDVGDFYLSKAAMIDLKFISHDFPQVNAEHSQRGDINEVQDGFPSGRLRQDQQVRSVHQ